MTHVDSVVVCARSWFDKTYGNSYYTLRCFVNGGNLLVTGHIRYGHGASTFWETAKELLTEGGYEVDEFTASKVLFDVCIVTRRKDLHFGGRNIYKN